MTVGTASLRKGVEMSCFLRLSPLLLPRADLKDLCKVCASAYQVGRPFRVRTLSNYMILMACPVTSSKTRAGMPGLASTMRASIVPCKRSASALAHPGKARPNKPHPRNCGASHRQFLKAINRPHRETVWSELFLELTRHSLVRSEQMKLPKSSSITPRSMLIPGVRSETWGGFLIPTEISSSQKCLDVTCPSRACASTRCERVKIY